ncbi:MAG: acylphosphatase [Chloroflexi bacterium]|nr:acylphosphatase [Chloroflexota bacterium]
MRRLHAFVSGRVQGVGYRDFVRSAALRLDVSGWVRNGEDGRVEVVAEGDDATLQALLGALREGPRYGRVDDVTCEFSDAERVFRGFRIEA